MGNGKKRSAPSGPAERKRACTEEEDVERRRAGEMAHEWKGTAKGRGVTTRWAAAAMAAFVEVQTERDGDVERGK